jgi:hypothetical protein
LIVWKTPSTLLIAFGFSKSLQNKHLTTMLRPRKLLPAGVSQNFLPQGSITVYIGPKRIASRRKPALKVWQ